MLSWILNNELFDQICLLDMAMYRGVSVQALFTI